MHELRVMCGSLLLDRVVAVLCVLYRRNYVMAGNSFKSISILNLYLCKKRKKAGWGHIITVVISICSMAMN